jgi:hypothetical protein
MPADSPGQRVITVIDLRKLDLDLLMTRRFHEVQAAHAPGGDWDRVDFNRAVIIDEVAKLAEHDDVYAHILTSGVDVSMLCVAVGQLSGGDPAVAIRRPYQLQSPLAATLWVSNATGIGWRMDSSQADVVYPHDSADTGDLPPGALTESLVIPQVFDRVLKAVGAMAGAVASPGMYINHGGVDPDRLRSAQQAAVRQLTRSVQPVWQQGPALEPNSLIGGARDEPSQRDPLRAGGKMEKLYQECQHAVDGAAMAAERLRTPSGLWGSEGAGRLRTSLSRLGDTAGQFAEAVEHLLDWADPQAAFDVAHYEELARQGIDIAQPRRQESAFAVDVLSDLTLTALDRHEPLPSIAEALRDAADGIVPHSTQLYLGRLRRLCPDRALRRLANPPPVTAGVGPPWLVALTALVGLVAGLWPTPRALCGTVAVLGCGAAAAFVTSRAAMITGATLATGWRFIAAQLGAAIVGAGCGIALSGVAAIPAPAGLTVAVSAVGLTLVLVFALTCVWWSILIRLWLQALSLPSLLRVARSLRGLLTEVATREWQPATERRAASDRARIMAGIIDDATTTLKAHGANLSCAGDRYPTDPDGDARTAEQQARAAERDNEILTVVHIDLADAVIAALNRLFAPLSAGSFAMPDAEAVRLVLEGQLASYAEHLATIGIYEAPPFGRGSAPRQQSVELLLERSVGLENLAWSSARDANIIQLCAPGHLGLLELDPARAEMVRFAPRSSQDFASRTLAQWTGIPPLAARVEWTATSQISGVLRLVPLRTGAVEEVLPAGHGGENLGMSMGIIADADSYLGAADWTGSPGGDDD